MCCHLGWQATYMWWYQVHHAWTAELDCRAGLQSMLISMVFNAVQACSCSMQLHMYYIMAMHAHVLHEEL